jgi:hypothetical protein
MIDRDPTIDTVLDRLVPAPHGAGDWGTVVRDAGVRRHGRIVALLTPVAAVVAVAAGTLLWPFSGSHQAGVLDRALAAVGTGPVLHVVLEGSWGGKLVDLRTGAETHVPAMSETWYDEDRDVIRSVTRLGGVVQDDETFAPGRRADDIARLGEQYRDALESGTARVFGEGRVEGAPVYWIITHAQNLPDVADGKNHLWTQQIAVSRVTYDVVATRETRDGVEGPGTRQLVRKLEYVSAQAADFAATPRTPNSPSEAMFFSPGYGEPELTLAEAVDLLGRAPVWLSREFRALPLARVGKEEMGRLDAATHERKDVVTGAVLVYGHVGDIVDGDPFFDGPYVVLRETTKPPSLMPTYLPPEGSAFISAKTTVVRSHGLIVRIEASSPELGLAAARGLETMPG